MIKTTALFATAFLGLATASFAQEEAAASIPEPEVQVQDTASAPAESVVDEAAAPEVKQDLIGTYGAWELTCLGEGEERSCGLRQSVNISDEENSPFIQVFLEKQSSAEGTPTIMTVTTPLGIAIAPGVSLLMSATDTARVWHAPYSSCLENMCLASGPVSTSVLPETGSPAIVFNLSNNESFGVLFSAQGVNAALNAMVSENEKIAKGSDLQDNDTDEVAEDAEAPAETE